METQEINPENFSLNLLGGFELRSASGACINLSAKKSRALLAYLALSREGTATRSQIASMLWSDTELTFAKTNLRQCLSGLRRQIDNSTNRLLTTQSDQLKLDLRRIKLDVDELQVLESEHNPAIIQSKLKDEMRAGLLADFPSVDPQFDHWLDIQRERYLHRLRQLLERSLDDNTSDSDATKDLAETLLTIEPENEKAHTWLMRFYIESGDRLAALRQYENCSKTLATQLDVSPGLEITRLYESVRQGSTKVQDGSPDSLPLLHSTQHDGDTIALPSETKKPANRMLIFGLFALMLVLAALLQFFSNTHGQRSTDATENLLEAQEPVNPKETRRKFTEQYSIAVIPFRNLSDNPDQAYLSDGISEDLVTEISRVSGINVIASESSFHFRNREDNLEQLKQQLPVDYLLTGSVRRSLDQLRINVHLIRTRDNTYIWSDKLDREMKDLLRVQDEITRHIVASLSVELTESEWQRLSQHREVTPEAYDLLLRGLHPFSQFTEEGVADARDYFKRSIKADPNYARPYANMALSFGREVVFQFADPDPELIKAGLKYADEAERLDPSLPQTQFARAVLYLANRDHQLAVTAAKKSITLDQNYADGYAVLAQTLAYTGKLDEALEAIFQARFLNPVVPFTYNWVEGHILYQLKRYDEAIVKLESVYESNPSFYVGLVSLSATYGQLGDTESADWINDEILTHRPDFSAKAESEESPYQLQQHRKHLLSGLRKAGLPE